MSEPPLGYASGPLDGVVKCLVCAALVPVGRVEGHTDAHRKHREADN